MPKSKRNKTVDLSKTRKHGLEGKKELFKKIQSNVENYAHVFVFAVNDMRNSKLKNVREQWKHSRFCIGKNKVMAMALGRTPNEEYRPNLHKIGQMLVGERGLLFTNQPVDEVTNWFQSYSEGDYARSGNIATEDVILPEGPLTQFPHNQESYLRKLGLPTTLKKGVIHLVKEHVVCTEGDRLSPETAKILKLLGYEMAEFHIKILSVWSQDGSFVNLQSDLCDPESKENAASSQKSFMREDFELAKDCVLLGDDDEMEVVEDENNNANNSHKEAESSNNITKDPEGEVELLEVVKLQTSDIKKSFNKARENSEDHEFVEIISSDHKKKQEPEQLKSKSNKKGGKSLIEVEENSEDLEIAEIIPCDLEKKREPEQVKSKSNEKGKSFVEAEKNSRESIEIVNCDLEEEPKQVKMNSKKKGNKSFVEAEEVSEIISCDIEEEPEQVKLDSKNNKTKSSHKEKYTDVEETLENTKENDVKNSCSVKGLETEDVEMEVEEIKEPEVKRSKNDSTARKSVRKSRKTVNKQVAKKSEEQANDEIINNEKVSSKEETVDTAAILKLTEKKLEDSAEKPKKFSPKMTRARAAAANKKIKTPEPLETKRSSRKRKM